MWRLDTLVCLNDGGMTVGITIHFLGGTHWALRKNPDWEAFQQCASISISGPTSSGFADKFLDIGAQIQGGKLLGQWTDIFKNYEWQTRRMDAQTWERVPDLFGKAAEGLSGS